MYKTAEGVYYRNLYTGEINSAITNLEVEFAVFQFIRNGHISNAEQISNRLLKK